MSKTETLLIQAQLTRYQTLADGGLRLIFDGEEPSAETGGVVATANKKVGVLVFKPDREVLSPDEKEAIKKFEVTGMAKVDAKSKSQQLRFALYHYYEKLVKMGEEDPDSFEHFYAKTMNKIISYYEGASQNG